VNKKWEQWLLKEGNSRVQLEAGIRRLIPWQLSSEVILEFGDSRQSTTVSPHSVSVTEILPNRLRIAGAKHIVERR